MFKLPIRTRVLNAAAVFSGQHGAVTQQAEQSACSRESVYQHARKVEQRLADTADTGAMRTELHAECQRLRQRIAKLEQQLETHVPIDKDTQRQLATTTFAMGLSLRQIEELLGILLPTDDVPDHSTLGHWVQAEAQRAGRILTALDEACAPHVRTLALDEIFFGGDRLWSESNRPA